MVKVEKKKDLFTLGVTYFNHINSLERYDFSAPKGAESQMVFWIRQLLLDIHFYCYTLPVLSNIFPIRRNVIVCNRDIVVTSTVISREMLYRYSYCRGTLFCSNGTTEDQLDECRLDSTFVLMPMYSTCYLFKIALPILKVLLGLSAVIS